VPEARVLTRHQGAEGLTTLAGYQRVGGYQALPKAMAMGPEAVTAEVKASGLRGRDRKSTR
jgi:NADH-quinone oxidoreductase subunit F